MSNRWSKFKTYKPKPWVKQRKQGKFETGIERKVKKLLLDMNVRFEQEKYFEGVGMVDFFLSQHNLVVECDGDYWHNLPGAKERDFRRDYTLAQMGYRVLRLPEHEINGNPRGCYQAIKEKL